VVFNTALPSQNVSLLVFSLAFSQGYLVQLISEAERDGRGENSVLCDCKIVSLALCLPEWLEISGSVAPVTSQVAVLQPRLLLVLHGGRREERVPGQHREASQDEIMDNTNIYTHTLCRISGEQDPIKELLFA